MIARDAANVAEAVRAAHDAGTTLEIVGTGTRRGYGNPVMADAVLDMSAIAGIVDYDPAELVLTARPGTPLDEVRALLGAHGQHLAWEPPGAGTLGGALMTGLSGPRRPSAGAARDHVLGFAGVNGTGEAIRAGGKVIKNVTGYDLPKLLVGSLGTLAVLTEVTVKVLPAPRATVTMAIRGLDDAAAVAAMTAALGSAAAVSGAAHRPGDATLLRLDGVPVSLAARVDQLAALLGHVEVLDEDPWATLCNCADDPAPIVWRVALPPSVVAPFVASLSGARALYDWGGGLVWLFMDAPLDVRAALARVATPADAHATLMKAPHAVRAATPVFQPLPPALAALNARVRARFDPHGVLNPGRIDGTA